MIFKKKTTVSNPEYSLRDSNGRSKPMYLKFNGSDIQLSTKNMDQGEYVFEKFLGAEVSQTKIQVA